LLLHGVPVPGIHPNAVASRGYECGLRIELALKDLNVGEELAELADADTVLDEATIGVVDKGRGDPR
jgi:hypothetical protein